ncbi:MAG: flagellar biosynthesis anti-sigma factor FlgM [Colwellia sp.]
MAININNLNTNNQVQQNQQKQQKQVEQQSVNSASNPAQVKNSGQDILSITPQAKQLNELQQKAADAPVINEKKIDELKKAISAGDYKIDADKLAANVANMEFNLL